MLEESANCLQFSVSKSILLKVLSRVQAIVERRPKILVLSNIKLECISDELYITATNMDASIIEKISDIDIQSTGQVVVSAHTLHDIVKKLPDNSQVSVEYDIDDENLIINSENSYFALVTIPMLQFPQTPKENFESEFILSNRQCEILFAKSSMAISKEDTRYYLCGLYLHIHDNKLRGVATDGHRLVRTEVKLPQNIMEMPAIIIPRKTVMEVIKIIHDDAEEIKISISKGRIRFIASNLTLISKLIDSTFPDYTKVIPESSINHEVLSINKSNIKDAIERVSAICTEKACAIKLKIMNNSLILYAKSENNNIARESMEINYSGDNIEIGFNANYLLEIINNIDSDSVDCIFGNHNNPTIIKDQKNNTVLYVIMPMYV